MDFKTVYGIVLVFFSAGSSVIFEILFARVWKREKSSQAADDEPFRSRVNIAFKHTAISLALTWKNIPFADVSLFPIVKYDFGSFRARRPKKMADLIHVVTREYIYIYM